MSHHAESAMALPGTPDFDTWPVEHALCGAEIQSAAVRLTWDDGLDSFHHAFFLRENSVEEDSLHPISRETVLVPADLPDDLVPLNATIDEEGALRVVWSHGGQVSRYHPGWLRSNAWFGQEDLPREPVLWHAQDLPEPPTFDGPTALTQESVFVSWLEALRDYGVARLTGLEDRDGLLEEVACRIGAIRETYFGRTYTLAIQVNPNSNAYTSLALPQHIDLPTRETPPGLQVLNVRRNTAKGGEGSYSDAFRIAQDMREEEPGHFAALCEIAWEFTNRDAQSDYRFRGPVIDLDARGGIVGVRYNTWLRAPLKAPLDVQDRAYRSIRAFARRAEDPRYQMLITYKAGDLFAFDNRRVLHGRRGYDAAAGERFIEGVYLDRDEYLSRIRTIRRAQRAAAGGDPAERGAALSS